MITLLSTRGGDYAAACALDFSSKPEIYYDTFALRDSTGHQTATQTYPYFRSSSSITSLLHNVPIPVQSCWNGIISMDTSPFYSSPPLSFRGVPDSLANLHIEGSECCLIHADNDALRREKGVWVNPNVRVAYNASTYGKVNPGVVVKADITEEVHGFELPGGVRGKWPSKSEAWRGRWSNRKARWIGWAKEWSERRVVNSRVERWIRQGKKKDEGIEEREEVGRECLVNEMQVLFQNGWQHL